MMKQREMFEGPFRAVVPPQTQSAFLSSQRREVLTCGHFGRWVRADSTVRRRRCFGCLAGAAPSAAVASGVVAVQWIACEHEGGEYLDNCARCAPFWARYPVAVAAEDVGRTVWITDKTAHATEAQALAARTGVARDQGHPARKYKLRGAP